MSIFDQVWRLELYGSDRQNKQHGWWYDNNGREPDGNCCLQFVMEGSVTIRRGTEYLVAEEGEAFMFYYGEDSGYGLDEHSADRCACEWINFSGLGMGEQFELMISEFGTVVGKKESAQLLSLARNLGDSASMHVSSDQSATVASVYNFIGTMFSVLEQAKNTDRKPVDKAIHKIISNPLYPWSIKEVVKDAGCSREHFTRIFTERFSQSPADWLNQQRVKHALYLLGHTNMSVQDIAIQAGFSSTHTMARQIKQETGQAPSQLR